MQRISVTIVVAADPHHMNGGFQTFVRGMIKYAPDDLRFEVIGLTGDATCPTGRWIPSRIGDREFSFFPVYYDDDANSKPKVPRVFTFIRNLIARKVPISGKVLLVNQVELALPFFSRGIPIVTIMHNDITKQILQGRSEIVWSRFPALYRLLERVVVSRVARVLTVSEPTLRYLYDRYGEDPRRFALQPTWFDSEIFRPRGESKRQVRNSLGEKYPQVTGSAEADSWILFVGRLTPMKGPLRLVQVFAEVQRVRKDVFLVIIGEGDLRERIEQELDRLGLRDRAALIGVVGQSELAEFYAASDLLLMTSESEGMPFCVLEALGCGLPVVTTRVSGVEKVVIAEESGLIVGSPDPRPLAEAALRVLGQPHTYSPERCIRSVQPFQPRRVLDPLYEGLRQLARANGRLVELGERYA